MFRRLAVLTIGFFCSTADAAELTPGIWKLTIARGTDTDVAVGIFRFDNPNGKWSAALSAGNTLVGKVVVDSMQVANGVVRLNLQVSDADIVFEGVVSDDPKCIRGSYGNDQRLVVAYLNITTDERIDRDTMLIRRDVPPAIKQFVQLEAERARLNQLVAKSRGDDHDKLKEDLANHQKKMDTELPQLFSTILKDHADQSGSCEAGLSLLSSAYKSDISTEQVRTWVQSTLKAAEQFGPRYRRDVLLRALEFTQRYAEAAAITAELAQEADTQLGSTCPAPLQAKVLAFLVHALTKTGKADEAKPFRERLEKLETNFDTDYRARLPKWEIKKFGERKAKANRVALVELFTGAECAPCVAASLACGRLSEMYKQVDVIALQYHLHTGGANPLANPDAESRYDFYASAYPQHADSIPAIFIGGMPRPLGGGPANAAKQKLEAYRDVINPILNEKTDIKLELKVKRENNRIILTAKANELGDEQSNRKLRFAVFEDEVRYPGGNGMRFHRGVVRAMPGGADGIALTKYEESHDVTLDLDELRTRLTKHLDEYAKNEAPFARPHRPLELKQLKAVAWIQDDAGKPILQAAFADIPEPKSDK